MSNLIKAARLVISQPKTIDNFHQSSNIQLIDNKQKLNSLEANNNPNNIGVFEELAAASNMDNHGISHGQDDVFSVNQILADTEKLVEKNIHDAKIQAEVILQEAHQDANQIIFEVQEKARLIEEQLHLKEQAAYDQGYEQGYANGKEQIEVECQDLIKESSTILQEAQDDRLKIINSAEKEIVEIAIAIAKKVIHRELENNPEYILDIVKAALNKASDAEELTLRVNPLDHDLVSANQDQLGTSAMGIQKLRVKSDATVNSGGCVIDTPLGTVDGRIERQVGEIEQSLMEVINND